MPPPVLPQNMRYAHLVDLQATPPATPSPKADAPTPAATSIATSSPTPAVTTSATPTPSKEAQ
jgi:hypothetical protein